MKMNYRSQKIRGVEKKSSGGEDSHRLRSGVRYEYEVYKRCPLHADGDK